MGLREFPRAVRAIEQLHGLGAAKHPNMASLNRPDAFEHNKRHLAAHLLELDANPEIPDPETGLSHAVHMAWRALATLEAWLMEHGEA